MPSLVKFNVLFLKKSAPREDGIEELREWCKVFSEHGLMPYVPEEKRTAGNLSFRVKGSDFIITASGLNSKDKLGDEDFVKVVGCDLRRRVVRVEGLKEPSSESMLHFAIYKSRGEINAVFHGHCESIVKGYKKLGLTVTERYAPFGTSELVKEVLNVLGKNKFIVIRDHGFISLGRTMEEAGTLALRVKEMLE